MRDRCKGGQEQIDWLDEQRHAMAETYDDVNFTPPLLGTITARALIVFGDIDPSIQSGLPLNCGKPSRARRCGSRRTAAMRQSLVRILQGSWRRQTNF